MCVVVVSLSLIWTRSHIALSWRIYGHETANITIEYKLRMHTAEAFSIYIDGTERLITKSHHVRRLCQMYAKIATATKPLSQDPDKTIPILPPSFLNIPLHNKPLSTKREPTFGRTLFGPCFFPSFPLLSGRSVRIMGHRAKVMLLGKEEPKWSLLDRKGYSIITEPWIE